MSISKPLPSQAPVARSIASYTVMSWQEFVSGTGDQVWPPVAPVPGPHCGVALAHGCSGVGGAFCRPLTAPVDSLRNSRGSPTIAAFCGAASGTRMTSIRHCDGLASSGVSFAIGPLQPASSALERIVPDVPWT